MTELKLPRRQPGAKTWVAEIIGPHPQYGFERRFLRGFLSKKETIFLLPPGVYDVCARGERNYLLVKNGVQAILSPEMVRDMVCG